MPQTREVSRKDKAICLYDRTSKRYSEPRSFSCFFSLGFFLLSFFLSLPFFHPFPFLSLRISRNLRNSKEPFASEQSRAYLAGRRQFGVFITLLARPRCPGHPGLA